jgi:hypothetical protein
MPTIDPSLKYVGLCDVLGLELTLRFIVNNEVLKGLSLFIVTGEPLGFEEEDSIDDHKDRTDDFSYIEFSLGCVEGVFVEPLKPPGLSDIENNVAILRFVNCNGLDKRDGVAVELLDNLDLS